MKAPRETALVKACLDYLRLRGVVAWRNNTGAAVYPGKAGRKRVVRYGEPGMPDILGLLPWQGGRMLCVEVKLPGREPTAAQAAFLAVAVGAGALCGVVRSLDDLEALLRENQS